MNGILCLGHFCETHGPCVMLCTQAIAEQYPKQPPHGLTTQWCNACKSINVDSALISRKENITYVTTRTALKQDVAFLLKQACVRSLSCEEETGKEDGSVYFGDSERGHVLSYTFRLPDSLARGFHRLFTILILMRDKVHLLNSWPFLTTHIRELIGYLKTSASTVNTAEQSECSQRVHRLATGAPSGAPRSLAQLTGLATVHSHVHSWFAWVLAAGAAVATDCLHVAARSPPWLGRETDEGFTLVQMGQQHALSPGPGSPGRGLREVLRHMGPHDFKVLCYCAAVGLQVIVRGPEERVHALLYAFSALLPQPWVRLTAYSHCYLPPEACNFLGLSPQAAVPTANEGSARVDVLGDECVVRWAGALPDKLPTFLARLLRTIEDDRVDDEVLSAQLLAFIEEWSNIAQALHWVQQDSVDKVAALAQALGVQGCDLPLVRHWTQQAALLPK